MLRIDRVSMAMDIVSPGATSGNEPSTTPPDAAAIMADPRIRERLKELVREALSDQLRELERRGTL
jgi:hypothetical protein